MCYLRQKILQLKMADAKPNEADKQLQINHSRESQKNKSSGSKLIATGNTDANPQANPLSAPDSELTYSQQIEKGSKVSDSKSQEPSKSNSNSKPIKDDDSQENKEKQYPLRKLNNASSSRQRKPARRKRIISRYKKASYKKPKSGLINCKHDRATTADSDDELSNNQQSDHYRAFKEVKNDRLLKNTPFRNAKSKTKKEIDLDGLIKRALVKDGNFKFSQCHFTINFF